MKNSVILLNGEGAKGRFLTGIISGTPKPGTRMQIKAAVEPVNGQHTYEVYAPTSDGDPRECIVLLEDAYQGKGPTDAYVSGTQGFMYVPLPGDELNMLVGDVAGTGDTVAIGDRFIGDTGTGKLVKTTTTTVVADFKSKETLPAPTADTLVWCMKL